MLTVLLQTQSACLLLQAGPAYGAQLFSVGCGDKELCPSPGRVATRGPVGAKVGGEQEGRRPWSARQPETACLPHSLLPGQ